MFFESVGRIIVINKTSSFIWEQLLLFSKNRDSVLTDEDIANRVISHFSCEVAMFDTILSDVRGFLFKLTDEGILSECGLKE